MVKVICGLGNPGSQYQFTRHNLGFEVIDRLIARLDTGSLQGEDHFDFWIFKGDEQDLYLVRPTTFMNRCGTAVAKALEMFEAGPGELFVISDDFNLPLGKIRLRRRGSAGGHKGLQSIIERLDTEEFPRLRIGTGPLPDNYRDDPDIITEFVLQRFPAGEEETVEDMISRAVEAALTVLNNNLDLAINIYNSANPAPEK